MRRHLVPELKMWNLIATGILLLALSNTLSASDCFLSDNIECICSEATLRCFGVQKEITEVKQMLLNVTTTNSTIDFLYLDWNIKNLTFESNFTFEGLKLQNMTIGSDLTSLPDDLFFGLGSTLIYLNLQNNNIGLLNNQPFSSLDNLKELYLDFNSFYKINTDILLNLNKLELLSLSGNNLNGLESDFLVNLPNIHTLVLDHNNFSSISDIRISSLNLKKLLARNCSMNGTLMKDSLKDVQNLEHVDFSSNQLGEIESNAFSDLHNLKELNLSYNVLNSLKDNALSSLHNLESLDLSNNKLLRMAVTSFKNLTNLKYLDLSENRLEVFYVNYTMDLYALESINLENNKIKFITTGTFSTSTNLQEILLKGNIFDCTCELSYFASYLSNNSHIRLGDSSAASCDSPSPLKGTPLIKSDIIALNCSEEVDFDEGDYDEDYSDGTNSSEIVTKLDEPTTERSDNSTNNDTSEIDPTTVPTATTVPTTTILPTVTTKRNNASDYNGTSETLPTSLPTVEITTTEIINTDDYNATSNFSDAITGISRDDFSTQETTTSNSSSYTIKEEISTPSQELENSTLMSNMSITSSEDLDSTSDKIKVTTPSVLDITQSEASKSVINILASFKIGKDYCFRWKISDKIINVNNCVIITEHPRGRTQKRISCPTSDKGKEQCVSTGAYRLCINVDFGGESIKQYCPITPSSTTITEGLPSSPIPYTSSTSESDDDDDDYDDYSDGTDSSEIVTKSDETTTERTGDSTYNGTSEINPTALPTVVSTAPVSEIPSTSPVSKIPSTSPVSEIPSTLPTSIQPNSSTDLTEILVEKTIPDPSKSKSSAIYFKVVSFDVTFINMNSATIIKWTVNKIEPKSICHLQLSLSSYNFNDTRGEFPCANNSHRIENIEYADYNVCLMSYHAHSKSQVLCKSSSHFYDPATSKYKDHGYANSPLIAVICLLIVVLIIIIILAMKKMMKKRSESDRYNVSAEEQKVQRRFSQKRPESCVRYSYTTKEHTELVV